MKKKSKVDHPEKVLSEKSRVSRPHKVLTMMDREVNWLKEPIKMMIKELHRTKKLTFLNSKTLLC
jgi:hypothetical protein